MSVRDAALSAARRAGDHLLELAVRHPEGLAWRFPVLPPRRQDPVTWEAAESVYDGSAGVALFLAELAAVTADKGFRRAAGQAMAWLAARLEEPVTEAHGFYLGYASAAPVLCRWAELGGDEEYRRLAVKVALSAVEGVKPGTSVDLLSGTGGLLLVLTRLYAATGDRALLSPMGDCINELAQRASAGSAGLCWGRSGLVAHGLCGLAHGAAGIGLALLEAGSLLDSPGARWLGRQAFVYEQQRFAEAGLGTWPDDRRDDVFLDLESHLAADVQPPPDLTRSRTMLGWCNGPAGIGLTRLRAFRLLGDEELRHQAVAAVNQVREGMDLSGDPVDLTLCHGLPGHGELFLEAWRTLGDTAYLATAERVAQAVMEREEWWFNATLRTALAGDPGLFLGGAGIGHFLLRIATRAGVPSIADPSLPDPSDETTASPRSADAVTPVEAEVRSVAAYRRRILASTMPGLFDAVEARRPSELDDHLAAAGEGNLDEGWQAGFLAWAAAILGPEGAAVAELERARHTLDRKYEDSFLAYRRARRLRRASELVALSDAVLLGRKLRVGPELARVDLGDGEPVLLEPLPGRVRQVALNRLAWLVLDGYGQGRSGLEMRDRILEALDLTGDERSELAGRVVEQSRVLLRRGLLADAAER